MIASIQDFLGESAYIDNEGGIHFLLRELWALSGAGDFTNSPFSFDLLVATFLVMSLFSNSKLPRNEKGFEMTDEASGFFTRDRGYRKMITKLESTPVVQHTYSF